MNGYRQFGNGYSYGDPSGTSFVSIDNTPQGGVQEFRNGLPVVAQLADWAQGVHQGRAATPEVPGMAAISALQQARLQQAQALSDEFKKPAPTGFGTIGGKLYMGGNEVDAGGNPDAYVANMRQQQAKDRMGSLIGTNPAGFNQKFLSDPRTSWMTPDQIEHVYDSTFGAGRFQQDRTAEVLKQQRGGPVTYADVAQYQRDRSPEGLKASAAMLDMVKHQHGVTALDLLEHRNDQTGMSDLPAVMGKNGLVAQPARQQFIHANEAAAIRKALNAVMGGGNAFPAPNPAAISRRDELLAKLNGQAAPETAAPVAAPVASAINPSLTPLQQSFSGAGDALGNFGTKWLAQPVTGAANHLMNLPTWLLNKVAHAQNAQTPYRAPQAPFEFGDYSVSY